MAKSICDVLGIKYPIIQGGMAWISDAVMLKFSFIVSEATMVLFFNDIL